MVYPEVRSLDPVRFRVGRNGRMQNVCFSDLTEEERKIQMNGRDREWLYTMLNIMTDTIMRLGDDYDLNETEKDDE